jgi:hypothetical protein
VTGAVLEGKQLGAEAFSGTVRRLDGHAVEAELDTPPAVLTNVRLRLAWPERTSGHVYGKVTGAVMRGGRPLVRVHLTSVEPAD